MNNPPNAQSKAPPAYTWLIVAIAGLVAPIIALLVFGEVTGSVPFVSIGLMSAGIIGAAVAGRFWIGVLLAVIAALALIGFTQAIGASTLAPARIVALGLAVLVASVSFAIRGALFAQSTRDKGWLIALFVVTGEAAILITAVARSGELPFWLLALLPAQWTNLAIQAALTLGDLETASAPLIALAGTAAATALVVRLWPRKWTYLIMFSTWIGFSALVYSTQPSLPVVTSDASSLLTGIAR
ncbi:MAG: hypothetical protein AAF251_02360 [Pseudomonadota bacterium]